MKKEARSKYWTEVNNKAFPIKPTNKKEMSNTELDQWLRGVLGG